MPEDIGQAIGDILEMSEIVLQAGPVPMATRCNGTGTVPLVAVAPLIERAIAEVYSDGRQMWLRLRDNDNRA